MSIVHLRDQHEGRQPPALEHHTPLRSPEHAEAPSDVLESLHHHRRQSSRLADRYFRFADDLASFFEIGGATSPRAALEMMREAEALRRSALDSVAQLSVVLSHVEQQAPAGAKDRVATVHRLSLVRDSG